MFNTNGHWEYAVEQFPQDRCSEKSRNEDSSATLSPATMDPRLLVGHTQGPQFSVFSISHFTPSTVGNVIGTEGVSDLGFVPGGTTVFDDEPVALEAVGASSSSISISDEVPAAKSSLQSHSALHHKHAALFAGHTLTQA
jgi:hypothetical protein